MTRVQTAEKAGNTTSVFLPAPQETPHIRRQLDDLLDEVAAVIAPVWPLKDYVAVNPYLGVSERPFMEARAFMKLFSDCETLMPLSYYADQFAQGQFSQSDIQTAIDELDLSASITAQQIIATINTGDADDPGDHRIFKTMAEHVDRTTEIGWSEVIRDEIAKHCAAHYDDDQAAWASPWKKLPLFQAWRSIATVDRNVESLGLSGFRAFVSEMPHTPDAAIVWLLQRLGVPSSLWKPMLLCEAYSIPGWSAWAKYQTNWTGEEPEPTNDFAGLLAIRLAYDVALSEAMSIVVDWRSACHNESASFDAVSNYETTARCVLLRASEIAYRDQLLSSFSAEIDGEQEGNRKLAQMVFCIDVRSERFRRNLEKQSDDIETFGFAGFFGMPIEFVPIGDAGGNAHVPVLLKPQFQLHEGLHESESASEVAAIKDRGQKRTWRRLWKSFQSSAVGCFSIVETTGLLYGWKLFARAIGIPGSDNDGKYDGIAACDRPHLGPTLRGLNQQGVTTSHQVDLAESMLKNLGLTKKFARIVAFCGHVSQTENNPLAAGLDCGACGGHSGEPNARLAAMFLNQPYIRSALADRGIEIPEDTYFLGGLHNTTTDEFELFDLDQVPQTHLADVEQLCTHASMSSVQTAFERMPIVSSDSIAAVTRRARDWSEVRPEWGLAGNAAFIVGPRAMTRTANLDGRSFLHSYDHRSDPDGNVLEGIMTAPMVVAHWINMQYYGSTVDNCHFGSGNKTVHNVVGRFGVLSGNGGDLMTGLPWQSLHTGDQYQHLPMRLQAVIAAPRDSIDRVIAKHESIANLVNNGWLHLIAIDEGNSYRYAEGSWARLTDCQSLCLAG